MKSDVSKSFYFYSLPRLIEPIRSVRADNNKEVKDLENDERYVRLLYQTMRNALDARGNFMLQAKGQEFIKALDYFLNVVLVNNYLTDLKNIETKDLFLINIEEAILSIFVKKLPQNSPNLPEDFFDIPLNINRHEDTLREKTGKKNTKTEKDSCGNTTQKDVDEYDDFKYQRLSLPNIDMMGNHWSNGIKKAKDNLWDIFCEWCIKQLNQASNLFEESVNEILDLAERALKKQLDIIENNYELKQQFWHNLEIQKDAVTEISKSLQAICRGENNV